MIGAGEGMAYDLMQKGGISKEQYEELQGDILPEVKKYWSVS